MNISDRSDLVLNRSLSLFKEHFECKETLVVVHDSLFKLLLLSVEVPILFFNIRHSQLVRDGLSWIVIYNLSLVFGP